jgi:predicted nucleic acid-binding protein
VKNNAAVLDPARLGDEEVAAPHLIDSEVTNVLRRLARRGSLTDVQATLALEGFTRLALVRYPADWLRPRIWALRRSLSAYDAIYVTPAELIGATALITADARLARAPGIRCPVDLV